jgi:N6-adenosine-specific RNA methylase IME4
MKFDVHYWDPPWTFDNKAMVNTSQAKGGERSGAAQKYACLPLADICALPLPAIAEPSAMLFLWVPTALKFSHGQAAMHAWGFDYITTLYWDKQKKGPGYWFANSVEELLVCQRRGGSIEPFRSYALNILHLPVEEAPDDIVHARPGAHSEKPDAFRQLIEQATGKISRRHCVEGFARKLVPGWTTIGNKVTGRDIRDDIRLLAAA